jgi:methylthioribose-1-phosphate isomerase
MQIQGRHYRTIWEKPGEPGIVQIINQCCLPHGFEILDLVSVEDFRRAIADMQIRGAGLIGATAAYGMVAAARNAPKHDAEAFIRHAAETLIKTRPTAVNLSWAIQQQVEALSGAPRDTWIEIAL